MESVHKTSTRPWISELINVKEFRDNWCRSLPSQPTDTREVFKMSDREFAELENECGLLSMKGGSQVNAEVNRIIEIPEGVDLETLRLQKAEVEKRENDPAYSNYAHYISKYTNYPSFKTIENLYEASASGKSGVSVIDPEVVLFVQIFRPEKKTDCYLRTVASRMPGFNVDQDFMVLGCQTLTELRDKIECVSDKAIPGEYSEHPDLTPEATCKDLFRSGFFYINGVFYNDMRHPDCRNYSQIIIDWSRNREIGPFRQSTMENTKFIDLEIQLGYPYVYVHQGNCEHLVVFTDLQLFTDHHNRNLEEYPARVNVRPKKRMICMICRLHVAAWITYDNKRVPENPFYFCKPCFTNFNYDKDGKKIGEFRAYHHIDRSNIF